jgi:hypothetical protein
MTIDLIGGGSLVERFDQPRKEPRQMINALTI